MKSLSSISLSKTANNPVQRHRIAIEERDTTNTVQPGSKSFKLQTLAEVLRCELGRPRRSSVSEDGLGPMKQWTPIHYAVYHGREAALLYFLRAGQTPDYSPAAQPLLCIAVAAGHINIIKILCEAGATLDFQCIHNGESPLHLAVKTARGDILEVLLQHKPDLNVRTSYTNETPLHYAAKSGSINSVVALLNDGANYEAQNSKGCSPAEVALQAHELEVAIAIIRFAGCKLHKLAKEKQLLFDMVLEPNKRSLLDKDLVAQVFEIARPSDSTALVEAIKIPDANIVHTLLNQGANTNEATTGGLYPIFAAFNSCSAPVVQALVEHGADVTLRNPHGPNVLQAALASPLSRDREAISQVFELLLSQGADARIVYPDGSTLLHRVVRPELGLARVAEQLLRYGLNIDAQDRGGNTALHIAATSAPCVTLLLKHGANPNTANSKGSTPLLCAIKSATCEDEQDLQYLIKVSDLGKADLTGKTALHIAAQHGLNKTVKLLLDARADSTSTDAKKRTPLLLAVASHQWTTVPLLAAQPGINSWDEHGFTALHHIAMSTPKAPSTWNHIAAAAASFCEKGVSRSMRDQSGATPLIQAAKTLPNKGLPVIDVLLSQKGSERSNCVAHEDHEQRNALYYAATLGKLAFVEALLGHGVPFSLSQWKPNRGLLGPNNAINKRILKLFAEYEWLRRMARLHRQSGSSRDEALLPKVLPIRVLNDMLSMGLDPNNLPKSKPPGSLIWVLLGQDILSYSFPSSYLHDAVTLAFASGADPNVISRRKPQRISKAQNSQPAPLMVHPLTYILEECPRVEVELIKLLLDNGAKLSTPSPLYDGRYPLHSAVRANRFDVVDELIRRNSALDCTDVHQRTPLSIAIQDGSCEMVDLLLRYRAKVDAMDHEGNTPLHVAAAAGNTQIVSRLLHAGAKVGTENHKGLTPLRCLPDKLSDAERQQIVTMLENSQRSGRRSLPSEPAVPRKVESATQLRARTSMVSEGKTVLKKSRNVPECSNPPDLPHTRPAATFQNIPNSHPSVRQMHTPAAPRLSKQMLSIPYTSPATQSIQAPIAPLSPSSYAPSSPAYRVDSLLCLPGSDKDKPLPALERKGAFFYPLGDFSNEGDELKSWLSVSRVLDRL